MILLDAMFLIEILLRDIPEFISVDRIFTRPGMLRDIKISFQFSFLRACLNHALPERYKGYFLSQFTCSFFNNIWKDILIDEKLLELYFPESRHFVDLLRLLLQPPERDDTERQADSEAAPSVTKLHQARIKFKLASSTKNLLDITYSKGTLEISKLTVGNMTVHLLRNLQIFEALHCDTNYINDYAVVLNRFLNSTKDVELLIHTGVIENRIMDSEGVSTLFRELSRDARIQHSNFYYSGLVKDLQDYCKSPCHKWKANLKQNYFNTPWASISVAAAVIILVLTFIQAVCSIIGL
ncbi:hypothetical protein ACOSQ2_004085 [Xanthoceras sorbifolium]